MKLRNSIYFLKLILITILMGTFPLVFVGFFSYIQSARMIETKVKEGNEQILLQSQLRVEQILKSVDANLQSFMNSITFKNSLGIPLDKKYYKQLNDFEDNLMQLQIYEMGVRDAALYNYRNQWKISTQGMFHFSSLNDDEWQGYKRFLGNSTWFQDEYGIKLIKKYPLFVDPPDAVVVAHIPHSRIQGLLSRSSGLGRLFIVDEEFQLIAQNEGEEIEALSLIKADPKDSYFTIELDHQTFGVILLKSDYNQWTYGSIVSIDAITRDSKNIGWITFWLCVLMIVMIIVFSILASNKMYSPIRRLYQGLMREGDRLSAQSIERDELQFIGKRMKAILEDHNRMNTQIQGQMRQLEEYYVKKLLLGEFTASEAEDKLDRMGYSNAWAGMAVVTVQVDTLKDTRYEERDKDLLMFAVNNIVGELIDKHARITPVVIGDTQVSLIGLNDTNADRKGVLSHIAQRIQAAVWEYLQLKVSVGISREFTSYACTPDAYLEALDALRYRVQLGEESILFIEDVIPEGKTSHAYPKGLEHELISTIKLAEREKIGGAVHHFLDELLKGATSHHELQISLVRLLIELIRLVQDSGLTLDRLHMEKSSMFDALFELKTADEIEDWFLQRLIMPIMRLLTEQRDSQFSSISDAVIQMIEEEYDSDLTLEHCAARINYHPRYVSGVFRRETGVSFSDYLSQTRMNMAKKWLVETDMKISEISDKLRYTSSTNFIRYFRKLEGVTPGQYREKIRDGG